MAGEGSIFERAARAARALGAGERLAVEGLCGAAPALLAARVSLERPVVVVCPDGPAAERMALAIEAFLPGGTPDAPRVLRLPADEVLPYDALSPDPLIAQARLGTLFHLRYETGARVLVTSAAGLLRRQLPPEVLEAHAQAVAAGDRIDRDAFVQALVAAGYARTPLCEEPGTFALRGGILDVFSPLYPRPLRIELFGDEVESLRAFDPATQRTEAAVEDAFFPPARETLFDPATVRRATLAARELASALDRPTRQIRALLDALERGEAGFGVEALLPGFYEGGLRSLEVYLPAGALFLLDQADACDEAFERLEARLGRECSAARERRELVFEPEDYFLTGAEREAWLGRYPVLTTGEVILSPEALDAREGGSGAEGRLRASQSDLSGLRQEILNAREGAGALGPLVERLQRWRERGHTVLLACASPGRADRLRRLLLERKVQTRPLAEPFDPARPRAVYDAAVHAHLLPGEVQAGFVDGEAGLCVVSDAEILGPRRTRRRKEARLSTQELAERFESLREGDIVVHVEHGIARYEGLTRLRLGNVEGDFLELHFAGSDKIFLPVHRMALVQRYLGGRPENVRLDRLGSGSFALRKRKVKEDVLKMAAELLDVYAARRAHPGTAFSPPDGLFRHFEAAFPYEETPDQARAIRDVLEDMQRPEPMDRLICGDVGFGKTEVAMRAAMKAVLDGKQVAVLVPTTVLAAQHEASFKERFRASPVVVEAISRFRGREAVREVLERTRAGKVDILIGTHRLLSKDVVFADLGLLIVDEEQRFGVRQKEALKKLRRQVDVLTLTATPIPRTLQMAVSGIRDLSIIGTPPAERQAIRTYVTRFDAETIRDAVQRELQRGGQVFFVHNRVQSIPALHRYLRRLLPEVRIEVAHGQMKEGELEAAMTRFVRREAELLLCTSIIESGLDIPSVNTILVSRADTFGLAQLHQLRGRVGRSRVQAYCYLLVPARRPITADARKRLSVLQSVGALGAGFVLASHDLEIRGAGNLLGPDQSGRIAAVGLDLYLQLLEEAVHELRGEAPTERVDPEVTLPLSAFLPDAYVPDVHQRLDLYKRAARLENEEAIEAFREELVDRYGPLPEPAEHLLRVARVRARLAALRLRSLEVGPGRVVVGLGESPRLDPARLASHIEACERAHPGRWKLGPDLRLVIRIEGAPEGEALVEAVLQTLDDLASAAAITEPGGSDGPDPSSESAWIGP